DKFTCTADLIRARIADRDPILISSVLVDGKIELVNDTAGEAFLIDGLGQCYGKRPHKLLRRHSVIANAHRDQLEVCPIVSVVRSDKFQVLGVNVKKRSNDRVLCIRGGKYRVKPKVDLACAER